MSRGSTLNLGYRPGDRCSNARYGCVGVLEAARHRRDVRADMTTRYVPDPDGAVHVLSCTKCGQAHGIFRSGLQAGGQAS